MNSPKRAGDGGDAIVKAGDGGGDLNLVGVTIKAGDGGNIYESPSIEKTSFWSHPLAKWFLGLISGIILLLVGWFIEH